ncbi:MAG: 3-oxoacid CoA-transferase subunit B [Dethiobacter sp.]|jgi:3-oxoacid CoA-transferase B subunit|nr:3-oxoacid CoA-transferase subunit B [Dethiobacter sp.]
MTTEEAKNRIAMRIAREFESEEYIMFINTGVGIPTLVPQFIKSQNVCVQAENGMLGVGPPADGDQVDPRLINASRQPVCEIKGCSYFDSAASFGMIRGRHMDATVLGALEVDQQGNVANWIIPNGKQLGVGGAMDLVAGSKRVIIAMGHMSKDNKPRIKKECSLPVTGYGKVDMLVTEYAVFVFEDGKMILKEIAPGVSLSFIRSITEADYIISPDLKIIEA